MAQVIQFVVDDTSPTVSYAPFPDTFSTPNLTAGWNPYFDGSGFAAVIGDVGSGTSYHATSHDNASVSIRWTGTGIELFGFTNNTDYTVYLDSSLQEDFFLNSTQNILAGFQDLSNGTHVVSLVLRMSNANSSPQPAFFFDKAIITSTVSVPPNHTIPLLPLGKSDVSYRGDWSLFNNSGIPSHHSNTSGDYAEAIFTGASFLLTGLTSPDSGKFSVFLDDTRTTLSAHSSFTQKDSLLFFATDLDPLTPHVIQVINDEGSRLVLNSEGFKVYAAVPVIEPTLTPTPTPSQTTSTKPVNPPVSPGALAAFVLAAILVFLLFSIGLYFCFVVRPRQRRAKLHRARKKRRFENGLGQILDIDPVESTRGQIEGVGHQSTQSKGSGFSEWKRDAEGGRGRGLGIIFRNSETGLHASPRGPPSARSTPSSKNNKDFEKGKWKEPEYSSQWSPSFVLDLPASEKGSLDSHIMTEVPGSAVSGLTSLSYVSAPSPPAPKPPPSYADSNSSSPPQQSVPRSVSQDSPPSQRADSSSDGAFLTGGERDSAPYESVPLVSAPPYAGDQGSTRSEDSSSYLGAATTRFAIRSLSPRTSISTQPLGAQQISPVQHSVGLVQETTSSPASSGLGGNGLHLHPREIRASAYSIPLPQKSFLDVPSPVDPHHPESPDPHHESSHSFLDVQPASPLSLDFSRRESQPVQGSLRSDSAPSPQYGNRSSGSHAPSWRGSTGIPGRSLFRLTPSSFPITGRLSMHDVTSFIDFSSSSDGSYRTRSVAPTEASGNQDLRWSLSSRLPVRWSNPLTADFSSEERRFRPPSSPPLPPPPPPPLSDVPENPSEPSLTRPVLPRLVTPDVPITFDDADSNSASARPHEHPVMSLSSPTGSLPISISEIRFRNRDSMDEARSHITNFSVPVLPIPENVELLESAPPPSTASQSPESSYIVQHTLGVGRPEREPSTASLQSSRVLRIFEEMRRRPSSDPDTPQKGR